MNPQVESMVRMLKERLPSHASVEDAAASVRRDMESIMGAFSAQNVSDLAEALVLVKNAEQRVEILRRRSIIKTKESWYEGPQPNGKHWSALRGFLENAKNWDHESITSIDESSTEVVSLLANPAKEQFRCRGLVVGYVQSGKTANMTAVIAKAVDAGYNLVVLLGGVTNKLRAQTQRRLFSDIVSRHRTLWQLYTTEDDDGDFVIPANRQFTMPVEGRAQLVVMKKETTRLGAFLRTIEHTPPAIMRSLKVLIIDDECDQASVNSSKKEYEMTRINEEIRKIIRALPAVSYVGYTATPFANVFIDPFPHNKETLDDLYPEDFITDLPRPRDYFGAREVFGYDPDDAEDIGGPAAGLDMIRNIDADDLKVVRPSTGKDRKQFYPEVPASLEAAILWWLMSSALRRRRGQSGSHMTMLVHSSPFVAQHNRMADAIDTWVRANRASIESASGQIWSRLEKVWSDETARVPVPESSEEGFGPGVLLPWLREVFERLEIVVENGESVERLDYTNDAKTYIVVGGSVLARGLTLEGLSVSYFLRTSQQYDTLLQMGRWFGFRHGYADLPRLWTTEDLAANFRALARVEEEIRAEIDVYRQREATPLQFAVKVRQIPGLAITSATKMRHAYRTSISYEGKHIQTIRFDHHKDGVVGGNWSAAARFVDDMNSGCTFVADRSLFMDVPAALVRRFLAGYDICDKHLDLRKDLLLDYVDHIASKVPVWNVAVVQSESGDPSDRALGALGRVSTVKRSRLQSTSGFADIKALMSKGDILVDAPGASWSTKDKWERLKALRPAVPLLLLYPINRESAPRSTGTDKDGRPIRVALDAVGDLLGIGVVFPGSVDKSGGYFSVELDVPTPEQLDDEELDEVDVNG